MFSFPASGGGADTGGKWFTDKIEAAAQSAAVGRFQDRSSLETTVLPLTSPNKVRDSCNTAGDRSLIM